MTTISIDFNMTEDLALLLLKPLRWTQFHQLARCT